MGPHDPKTKQAWQQLNEKFGVCPKCGIAPFEGYDAVKSYTHPPRLLMSVLAALATNGLLASKSSTDDFIEFGEYLLGLSEGNATGLAKLSEAVIAGSSEISNVKISQDKFECANCAATWNPGAWETTLGDLGLVAYQY